jgi:hypothetical protein
MATNNQNQNSLNHDSNKISMISKIKNHGNQDNLAKIPVQTEGKSSGASSYLTENVSVTPPPIKSSEL